MIKIDKKILDAVLLSGAGALTDANPIEVDFGSLGLCREFVLSADIVPNTTSPGANTWLAINWYWSDYKITTPATNCPLLAPTRKFTSGPIALNNATFANNGEMYVQVQPAETLSVLTLTASTTTATLTFPPGYNPRLNVGDLVMVSGGVVGAGDSGHGSFMQGVFALTAVTHTSGANGQLVITATYTISSTSGTITLPIVQVVRDRRRGGLDAGNVGILRPMARYMYTTVDRSALTTNATTTLSLNMVRVPSTSLQI